MYYMKKKMKKKILCLRLCDSSSIGCGSDSVGCGSDDGCGGNGGDSGGGNGPDVEPVGTIETVGPGTVALLNRHSSFLIFAFNKAIFHYCAKTIIKVSYLIIKCNKILHVYLRFV